MATHEICRHMVISVVEVEGYGLESQVVALGGGRKLGGLLAVGWGKVVEEGEIQVGFIPEHQRPARWVLARPSFVVARYGRGSCQVVRDTSSCPPPPSGVA